MKKILFSLSLLLALGTSAMAANLPKEGAYLNKDGALITAEDEKPPVLTSSKMPPQTQAIHDAMASLPHSASTILRLTINDEGSVIHKEILQSCSSLILDQYAADSVDSWRFSPAMRGEKAVTSTVSVPIHFVSTMMADPPVPVNRLLKNMSETVQKTAEKAGHPMLTIRAVITAEGKVEGKPVADKEDNPQLSPEDFKILAAYAEDCVRHWTFTPARNPDGEPMTVPFGFTVQL